ncbi:MAG TPA: hypothetical protein VFU05_06155 [Cyclobacteriaceae bacterium]|nr:hypothetical protein [Cyclobacteriaceae bacterium]
MEMNLIALVKPILVLISIIIGLYLLASAPKPSKGIDYRKIIEFVKRNSLKLITVGVVLYAAYITLLYNNSKTDAREDREEYYASLDEATQCRIENERLTEKVDSLTLVVNAINPKH